MSSFSEYIPNEQQTKQLDYLKNLVQKCSEESIDITVYGGYGLDGLLGKLTRDHHDFDVLVMESEREKLKILLLSLGYFLERENSSKEVFKHDALGTDFQIEINKQNRLDEFLIIGEENIFPKTVNAHLLDFSFKTPTLEGHNHIHEMQAKRAKEQNWGSGYLHEEHTKKLKEMISKI